MNTMKMIAELKMTCGTLEAEKNELLARVKELDDKLTGYRMAIDSLDMTLKTETPVAVEPTEAKVVPLPKTCRKDAKRLTFNGKTQTVQQWADELHMSAAGIKYRLNAGWSVADTLTHAPNPGVVVLRKKQTKSAMKVFKYDRMDNPIRQYTNIADAAKDLRMSEATIQKIIGHVSKADQLKAHDWYLDYAK